MSSMLFDDLPELTPSSRVRVPPLWIERLLILKQLSPSTKPEREIEFRKGLNIIATKKPQKNQRGSVGHNVGKTLLTRLIRYCLGESKFARENDRKAISNMFPEGYVVAEIVVEGAKWTVARPIGPDGRGRSLAWPDSRWSETDLGSAKSYAEFRQVLEAAMTAALPTVTLPNSNRAIQWADLLAWCSRDQRCAYQHPLEWRSKWSESGKADLSKHDASLIVRASMNLLDNAESNVIFDRRSAQTDLEDATRKLNAAQAECQRIEEALITKFGFTPDSLADAQFQKRMAAADNEINDLMAAIEAVRHEHGLDDLELEVVQRERELQNLTAQLDALEVTIEGSSLTDLRESQEMTEEDFLRDIAEGCPITHPDCSVHNEQQKRKKRDTVQASLRDRRIVNLVAQQVGDLRVKVETCRRDVANAKKELILHTSAADVALRQPETNLERWQTLRASLRRWYELNELIPNLQNDVERFDKKEKELTQLLKGASESSKRRLQKLNHSFQIIQQELFGKDGLDRIRIDVNRLSFPTDDDSSSPGDGMSASTTLSLDIACLRASLEGLGNFPRFVIHDSPRAGDLEDNCYSALFKLVRGFEDSFDDPPFQYIVTTTTQPPSEFKNTKYVREVLASDDPTARLLRRTF